MPNIWYLAGIFTGGTFKLEKPTQPTECAKPGLPLLRSRDGVGEIWTCPTCNADIIDGWAEQPGVITIRVGK